MNQSLDLTFSFIIGGIVLFSLIGLTLHFTGKSQETKLTEITHRSALETGAIIEHDFRKLGYGANIDTAIVSLSNKSITFKADLNNDGNANTISYTEIKEKGNTFLERKIDNQQNKTWTVPVSEFSIFGITSAGDTTQVIENIRSIIFEMRLSEKGMKGDTLDVGVFWRRQFFPKNL